MNWLIANWQELSMAVTAIFGALAMVAKLTPTPKDDKIVAKILNFLNLLPRGRK